MSGLDQAKAKSADRRQLISRFQKGASVAETSKRCFVISPIGSPGSPERKHADMTLNAIIKPALADCGIDFVVKRGDESSEIGMITDHIIADILESELIVTDLSFLNPNVFYELGIAHAVEKPVIHIAHRETKLPFDNVGHRAIMFDPTDWHSQVETRGQIADSARNVISNNVGAVSNPITHARGWKKLKASADSEQTIVARLLEEIALIKTRVSYIGERMSKESETRIPRTNYIGIGEDLEAITRIII